MVISRGLGNGIAPVRVNNPRELVIVDLVQEQSQG
jgi:predicted MPP superfamily phosphohydrolase